MAYDTEEIIGALKAARAGKQLSQRDLSALVGVPQAHISKIENGAVDPRVSSLIELARALDLEVKLVPRKLVPAVDAITRSSAGERLPGNHGRVLRELKKIRFALGPVPDVDVRLTTILRELENLRLGPDDEAELHAVSKAAQAIARSQAFEGLAALTKRLQVLRNRVVHRIDEPVLRSKPAYSLDNEDDDA